MRTHRPEHLEDHDRGLELDLPTILHRRSLLKFVGGAGLAALGVSLFGTSSRARAGRGFSGDPRGNSRAVSRRRIERRERLTQSGIVRSDIRSSFGSSTTIAQGVPTTITLTVTDFDTGNTAAQGLAVYLWHCNREGLYSLYSPGVTNENYLRGVQVTDANGQVTFTSIFPACYSGRWPHIHFEVYPSLASATSAVNKIATSQMALPKAICDVVFATSGYSQSVTNLAQTSLATDNVFSDGATYETPTYSGDVTSGIALAMDVAVHAKGAGNPAIIGDTTITPTTAPATIGATSAFVPLASPRRLLDTRAASQTGYTGGKPAAGATVALQVLGREGVPASDVSAVVLNVTATEATAAGLRDRLAGRRTADNLKPQSRGSGPNPAQPGHGARRVRRLGTNLQPIRHTSRRRRVWVLHTRVLVEGGPTADPDTWSPARYPCRVADGVQRIETGARRDDSRRGARAEGCSRFGGLGSRAQRDSDRGNIRRLCHCVARRFASDDVEPQPGERRSNHRQPGGDPSGE